MKLLYLVPKFDICYNEKGSAAKPHGGTSHARGFIFNIANYFEEVHVICKKEGKGRNKIKKGNVTIHRINFSNIKGNKTNPISAIIKTFKYARQLDKKNNFEVIYEREEFTSGAGSLLKLLNFKKKLILEVNSPHVSEAVWRGDLPKIASFLFRAIEELQFLIADRIITTIPSLVPKWAVKKTFLTEWSGGENIKLVKMKKSKGKKLVLFIGSMSYWHGAYFFAKAAKRILKKRKDVKFVLIGKGREFEKIKKEIRGFEKNIILTGGVDDSKISEYLQLADICVAPFESKKYPPLKKYGFYWSPIKLWDYMKAGKPIISSKIAKRIVDEKIGLTFKEGDLKDFENKIIYLIENEELRKRMSKEAQKKWKENNWKEHTKKIYKKVIKKLV